MPLLTSIFLPRRSGRSLTSRLLCLVGLLTVSVQPAAAEFTSGGFELVHNAPAGTTLATPDLRDRVRCGST